MSKFLICGLFVMTGILNAAFQSADFGSIEQFYKLPSVFNQKMRDVLPESQWVQLLETQKIFVGDFLKVSWNENKGLLLAKRGSIPFVYSVDKDGFIQGFFLKTPVYAYKTPEYVNGESFDSRLVEFGDINWKLPGILTIPKNVSNPPVLVLVPGSGPSDQDESVFGVRVFKDVAEGLSSNGIAVLRYANRQHALKEKYARIATKATINEQTVDDAVHAFKFIKRFKRFCRSKVFVLGYSQGGFCMPRIVDRAGYDGAVLFAANCTNFARTIFRQHLYLMCPTGEISKHLESFFTKLNDQMNYVRSERLTIDSPIDSVLMGSVMPPSWWLDIRDYNPANEMARHDIPILVMQGDSDYQVTMADYGTWLQELGQKKNAEFVFFPKLTHLFHKTIMERPDNTDYFRPANVEPEVVDKLVEWIQEN
jgi:pimeloyl-ACP methyl ester carboxylesterase